ncbi:hypothetical protein [Devosia faecipullorum]|uniref:hypothetical protein n=1 Tax=Devosia faecipullorum TaxID=2755039 RepID=UPI00187B96BD|nr:hypothetical protein [Devosia faecipullorum]MBE7732185.1 hypothetical protein [Devosia faecipullorum]
MTAVRKKIYAERIPCSEIIVSGRPMLTAVRARILRGEIDDISLSRALLIADAVGVDLRDDLVPRPAPPAPKPEPAGPTAAQVLAQIVADAKAAQQEKAAKKVKRPSPMEGTPTLFELSA